MNKFFSYLHNNKSTSLITLLPILLFALLFSHVLLIGQSLSQNSAIFPSWQQQQWLEYPGGSEVLYTRKNFNLNTTPEWASLTVSAIDSFVVYVNGRLVGKKNLPGKTPARVYDVTPFLQSGKNTLAIRSVSEQRRVNARIIAKLSWRALGKDAILSSNQDWRVEKKESFQRQGELAWFKTDYEENHWIFADTPTNISADRSSSLLISEYELQKLQPKNWIWVNDLSVRRMNLSRTFDINTNTIKSAWLGINIKGSYQLAINNLVFPKRSGQQKKMNYFSFAPYLKKGENQISLQLQSVDDRLDKIAISGLVLTENNEINFSADLKWFCGKMPCRFVSVAPKRYPMPQLNAIRLPEPLKHTLLQSYTQFKWFILIFLASLLPAKWLIPLLTTHDRFDLPQACLVYSQPYGLVALLLAAILAINADSRFDITPYYAVFLPLLVVILIALLLFQLAAECDPDLKPRTKDRISTAKNLGLAQFLHYSRLIAQLFASNNEKT